MYKLPALARMTTLSGYLVMELAPVAWVYAFALALGLVIGSFLNVLILRLPQKLYAEHQAACTGESITPRWFGLHYLMQPASHCPHCHYRLKPWHNIPVLSWLWLRARCAECGGRISVRYPLIELLTGLLTLLVVWRFGMTAQVLSAALLSWGLLALAVIDWDEQLLPDELTQPLLWLGLLVNLQGVFVSLADAVLGAVIGYLVLWSLFHLFLLLTGKEGMGFGDFKLYALLGAWLGWSMLLQIVLISSLAGVVFGVIRIVWGGHDCRQPMPFGPFLVFAGLLALFEGQAINHYYLHLMGM